MDIPPGDSLTLLQLVGLIAAALIGLALIAVVKRRRARARQSVPVLSPAESPEPPEHESPEIDSLGDHQEVLKRTFTSDANDLDLNEIPSFTSLPSTKAQSGAPPSTGHSSESDPSVDVSSLLFRLLGTKARICELERAEMTKTRVLTSTCEALESLKESLDDSSPELREEIDEMHELITGELATSRESSKSARELKEIIDAQYDLLKQPGAVYAAELLLAKQSYVETIDASLDRRLKIAEKRETEFALGKERIMALKKQMLKVKDSETEVDTTRPH